jgi:hypothetical protein
LCRCVVYSFFGQLLRPCCASVLNPWAFGRKEKTRALASWSLFSVKKRKTRSKHKVDQRAISVTKSKQEKEMGVWNGAVNTGRKNKDSKCQGSEAGLCLSWRKTGGCGSDQHEQGRVTEVRTERIRDGHWETLPVALIEEWSHSWVLPW